MSNLKVTASAELMENYIHSDFLLPQKKFLALQTDVGASLLFSIGTGGILYLTIEDPGNTHGWRQVDLSSKQILSDFAGKGTVKTFGATQVPAVVGGAAAQINLAMVINDGTNDHLYISLGNSDADLSWADKPTWTAAPFNAVDDSGKLIVLPNPFLIANVLIGEATDQLYIVIDTISNPGDEPNLLARYYIDISSPTKPTWTTHDIAIDVEALKSNTCLGRTANGFGVDGLYTQGKIGAASQLIYTPLYNAFDQTMPPLPSRFNLPGGLIGDAIACMRNKDNSTDLYVSANESLYWFASDNQKDGATGILVATSPLLKTVGDLFVSEADGYVVVWGLNSNNEVFYLACPSGSQSQINQWSRPLPILTKVDAISPFIDRNYSAKTFFAQSSTGLIKLIKSPTTSLWNSHNITLPPMNPKKASEPIHSYTTHIKITDDIGKAVAYQPVTISASNVTSVYINHLYYLVGPNGIDLTADDLGTITIVETATSLAATRFQVTVGSLPAIPINTMDSAWKRNAAYSTPTSLQAAQIVDRHGNKRNFLPAGTSQDNINSVAQSNKNLGMAYDSLTSKPHPMLYKAHLAIGAPNVQPISFAKASLGDSILSDIGDLFNWLASGVAKAIQLIKDAATGFWHFVVTIGDAIYHAALDCVEAILAAATWVYDTIKVAVEDALKFLEFIFGWQDIVTTHRVMKNIFTQFAYNCIDQLSNSKADIATVFTAIQHDVNKWANIPDFDQTLGKTTNSNPPPEGQNGSPSNLGVHHFKGNSNSMDADVKPPSVTESIFDALLELLEKEEDTLSGAYNAIKTDIIDQFDSLSVTEIIKKFIAIIVDTLLQTVENILLAVVDVFIQLIKGVMDVFTTTIDIPVLSWLYKDISGEDLSFLDLICLIAAIPATIVFKIGSKVAPFPKDDPFTIGLLAATNFDEVRNMFFKSGTTPVSNLRTAAIAPSLAIGADAAKAGDNRTFDESKLKVFGIVAGIFASIGTIVLIITTTIQRGLREAKVDENAPLLPPGIDAINKGKRIVATVAGFGNLAYVSPNIATFINIKTDNWYQQMNNTLTGISIVKGFVNIALSTLSGKKALISPAVESIINTAWNLPVIMNVKDNKDRWNTDYKSLIPETIGNFAFNIGGMMEFPISFAIYKNANPQGILYASIGQFILMGVYGLCMPIAGGIYEWAPGQNHK